MLSRRRRRRPNIEPTLVQDRVFAGFVQMSNQYKLISAGLRKTDCPKFAGTALLDFNA